MYLSRIEMTGFKSFADKTVIEFDQGMTAVVGPNGSGKSNLSEAIRWVLGEQSAKSLRGSRMEDVIFNGTQERKPVNIAKVTLVLNNEDRYLDYDYSEISISRSYNRNGDSEYLINNESVRLKDIVDLLLDSGLGKNSFSIISQGQVEQIFLNKPEERRVIFEEAAGVQKYQYRKNEASRKLERSSDNLSRVKDIIYEIEQQLKPLAKQRETALVYQEKKAILKELEISLYTYQIEQYQKDYEQNNADLEKIERTLRQLETELNQLNHQLHQSKNRQIDLTQELDHATDAYQTSIQTIEQLKSKYQIKEQERQFSQTQRATLEAQSNKQQEEIARQTITLNEAQEKLEERKKTQTVLDHQIEMMTESKQQLESSQNFSQEEWQANLIDWYQKQTHLKNQIHQLTDAIEFGEKRFIQLQNALEIDQETATKLEAEYQEKTRQAAMEQYRYQTRAINNRLAEEEEASDLQLEQNMIQKIQIHIEGFGIQYYQLS